MKKILYVTSTNYQIMFSYVINQYIPHGVMSFLISYPINGELAQAAQKLKEFDNICILRRYKKVTSIKGVAANLSLVHELKKLIREIAPDAIIVFKDNDLYSWSIIDVAKRNNVKVLMIQEGLSIYADYDCRSTLGAKLIKRAVKYPNPEGFSQGYNTKVDIISVTHPCRLPSSKGRGKQIVEMPSCGFPVEVIKKFMQELNISIEDIVKQIDSDRSYIYVGQPLADLKIIDEKREINYIKEMSEIINSNGCSMVIKPHPSESLQKYADINNCVIINNIIPAEVVLAVSNPLALITPYSSSAMNISAWSNIPILYTYKLIGLNRKIIDNDYDNVKIVNNFTEFNQIVKGIKSNQKCAVEQCADQYKSFAEEIYTNLLGGKNENIIVD